MSLLTHIRKQPEDVRHTILFVVMFFVAFAVGTFGIATIKGRFVVDEKKDSSFEDHTPFLVLVDIAKQGVATVSAVGEDAQAGWIDIAHQTETWSLHR